VPEIPHQWIKNEKAKSAYQTRLLNSIILCPSSFGFVCTRPVVIFRGDDTIWTCDLDFVGIPLPLRSKYSSITNFTIMWFGAMKMQYVKEREYGMSNFQVDGVDTYATTQR